MRKLYAILVLMVLMFGISSVFAQGNSEEDVAVSVSGGSASGQLITAVSAPTASGGGAGVVTTEENVGITRVVSGSGKLITSVSSSTDISESPAIRITSRMCVVNAELMGELDRLMVMLKKAEENDDEQSIRGIEEKIHTIKEEIKKDTEKCESSSVQTVSERIVKAIPTKVTAIEVRPTYMDKCAELSDWREKKKHYENLFSLSDEELKNKGYSKGKEEIKKILEELEEGIKKIRIECESRVTGGGVSIAIPESAALVSTEERVIAITKPIIAVSEREVTDYYKLKISRIMGKEINVEQQVRELKELRNEIDNLIEELIKSKDEISAEEISGLVTEIKIKPKEIKADNVVISTINKRIAIKLNKKDLMIKPTETQVIIEDENLVINALELSIKNNVLKVGDSEVKLTASDVMEKINVEPTEIELKEENSRAVYKIKVDENRKILGIIPIKVEKDLTVDAVEAEILKDESPWWTFMSTKP